MKGIKWIEGVEKVEEKKNGVKFQVSIPPLCPRGRKKVSPPEKERTIPFPLIRCNEGGVEEKGAIFAGRTPFLLLTFNLFLITMQPTGKSERFS